MVVRAIDELKVVTSTVDFPRGQGLSVIGLFSERFVDKYFPNLWNEHQCATWWLEKSQTILSFGLLDREELSGHRIDDRSAET